MSGTRVTTEANGPVTVRFNHWRHDVHEVTALDGEVVAFLCADCDEQLPANYECSDCVWVEVTKLQDEQPSYILARPCRYHA